METIKNTSAAFHRGKLLAAAFTLGFALLTGLSPLLHNHDLDFKEFHKNCAPCHLAHSSATSNSPVPEITHIPDFQTALFRPDRLWVGNTRLPFSSRAPPAIS